MREAEGVTNLAEATLRKYAQVARNGVRVDGVHFSHHIEVQRCFLIDEKDKRRFDANAALQILTHAKEQKWKVADTRAEVKRRFPTPKVVETLIEKTRRLLLDTLKTIEPSNHLMFLDALAEVLPLIREQVEQERNEAIWKIFNSDDNFDDPSLPF
jgi:hypothetical protein